MAIRLVFLGKLADLAGAGEGALPTDSPIGWEELVGTLDEPLRQEVCCEKVRVALNGSVLADKSALQAADGDEIAFLPVSGG